MKSIGDRFGGMGESEVGGSLRQEKERKGEAPFFDTGGCGTADCGGSQHGDTVAGDRVALGPAVSGPGGRGPWEPGEREMTPTFRVCYADAERPSTGSIKVNNGLCPGGSGLGRDYLP